MKHSLLTGFFGEYNGDVAMKSYTTIDDYIASYPKNVQALLRQMRKTIKAAAPKAEEAISYGIATFKLNGNLVHFGGFVHHVSFFPGSAAIVRFKKELQKYTTSKGTVQFPFDEKLPLALIKKIVKFRVKQNEVKKKK